MHVRGAGSLLGVERHKGITPWTSDADLIVARVGSTKIPLVMKVIVTV